MASSSIQPLGHNRHGPKTADRAPFMGQLGPHLTQRRWAEAYRRTKCQSTILIHPSFWPQYTWTDNCGLRPLLGGGAGSPRNTMSLGLRPISLPSGIMIHPAIWPQQIWAENWGLCPLLGEGHGSPSSTMWPGRRPTLMPSGILIDAAIWSQ